MRRGPTASAGAASRATTAAASEVGWTWPTCLPPGAAGAASNMPTAWRRWRRQQCSCAAASKPLTIPSHPSPATAPAALLLTATVALAVIAVAELAWAIPMYASGGGGNSRSGSSSSFSSGGNSSGGGGGTAQAATTAITVGDAAKWPTFLVLGDWGRDGKHKQSSVADAMAQAARRLG